jgi:hypothetical protein
MSEIVDNNCAGGVKLTFRQLNKMAGSDEGLSK